MELSAGKITGSSFNPTLTSQKPAIQYLYHQNLQLMKKILMLFILIMSFQSGNAQNILQGDANRDLEQKAQELADRWAEELSMTAKQTALMEDKLVEYALKKNTIIQSKINEEAKTRQLLLLQEAENKAMRDILTKPQHERYLFLLRQEVEQKSASDPEEPNPEMD